MLIGHWTDSVDRGRLDRVLAGEEPFDEATMLDEDEEVVPAEVPAPAPVTPASAVSRR